LAYKGGKKFFGEVFVFLDPKGLKKNKKIFSPKGQGVGF